MSEDVCATILNDSLVTMINNMDSIINTTVQRNQALKNWRLAVYYSAQKNVPSNIAGAYLNGPGLGASIPDKTTAINKKYESGFYVTPTYPLEVSQALSDISAGKITVNDIDATIFWESNIVDKSGNMNTCSSVTCNLCCRARDLTTVANQVDSTCCSCGKSHCCDACSNDCGGNYFGNDKNSTAQGGSCNLKLNNNIFATQITSEINTYKSNMGSYLASLSQVYSEIPAAPQLLEIPSNCCQSIIFSNLSLVGGSLIVSSNGNVCTINNPDGTSTTYTSPPNSGY